MEVTNQFLKSGETLRDRVAVITGAGSGIGKATSILFAKEGAKVIAVGRSENIHETVKEIREKGGEAMPVKADVSVEKDVEKVISTTLENYGKIEIVFNNAGVVGPIKPLHEYEENEWNEVIAINLKGTYLMCKHAIRQMIKQGKGGVIINMASALALMGLENRPAYTASKGAIISLTRALALECGKYGIRVNCLVPGMVDTPMQRRIRPPGVQPSFSNLIIKRMAKAEEIAYAALYLASDYSSYMTGACLIIDGGETAI